MIGERVKVVLLCVLLGGCLTSLGHQMIFGGAGAGGRGGGWRGGNYAAVAEGLEPNPAAVCQPLTLAVASCRKQESARMRQQRVRGDSKSGRDQTAASVVEYGDPRAAAGSRGSSAGAAGSSGSSSNNGATGACAETVQQQRQCFKVVKKAYRSDVAANCVAKVHEALTCRDKYGTPACEQQMEKLRRCRNNNVLPALERAGIDQAMVDLSTL